MVKTKRKTEYMALAVFLVAVIAFLLIFSAVTRPKRVEYGANWGPFLKEPKNSIDIMFFGSSVVYCDVIPNLITEQTGKTAYVLAGPEQTIPMTYYYIKEMYRTQSPSDVLVDVTAMFFPRYTDYTKANIGYMPWSWNRVAATFKTAEPEQRLGLLFPPYNYHDRWHELEPHDLVPYSADTERGYTRLDEANEMDAIQVRWVAYDEDAYNYALSYLTKIKDLCEKNGSRLHLYMAPAYRRLEPEYVDKLESDIADMGCAFIDFDKMYTEIGIDDTTDYYDFLHFNYDGAVKFTTYLTALLLQ